MATFTRVSGHGIYEIGWGSESLVIFPGLSDAFQPPRDSWLTTTALEQYYYRSYRDDYTLYVISRRRNLDEGTTTREMAAGYAEVLETIGEPVHLEGLSMGGLIGQHLAADRPDLIKSLVVAVSGAHLSDRGLEILRRWRDMAANGDWFEIYLDSIQLTYGDSVRARLYSLLLPALRSLVLPKPEPISDIVVQSQACIEHDTTDKLNDIDSPTLVIGGADDLLFPPEILRETADRISGARLEILEHASHGAFEQRKRVFDSIVQTFLTAASES